MLVQSAVLLLSSIGNITVVHLQFVYQVSYDKVVLSTVWGEVLYCTIYFLLILYSTSSEGL